MKRTELDFGGRLVLITGAATRIGRATAGLVPFLASDLANVITGTVYPIDGARTAH